MLLRHLRVAHVLKRELEQAVLPDLKVLLHQWLPGSFLLETCQRVLCIADARRDGPIRVKHVEVFEGWKAYCFLLEVAAGLRSEVLGETDIFGQLKDAWARFQFGDSGLARELAPWMQNLFEDTKDVRSNFLQNVGGASYGSLVRKLLKRYSSGASSCDGEILLVGAGNIAHSVAPWLAEHELWLWNRSQAPLQVLRKELEAKGASRIKVLRDGEELDQAWRNATFAVICIPLDSEKDAGRIHLWKEGGPPLPLSKRAIVHLGALRSQCGDWCQLPNFHSLDDLFDLQKTSCEYREQRFERALNVCVERAMLRSLPGSPGGSLTLPHGWEDLAMFG